MFENVGGKLKSISVVLFWIEAIAALVTGIVVWYISYDLGFLWFLLIAVGGIATAYFSALVMYAIGESAENSTLILQEMKKSETNSSKVESIFKDTNTKNNALNNTNSWKCTSCGRVNANYVGTCGCGTRKPN